ncbi:hypothetical protein R4Z09_14230 [Niallia oryzisoli]|uniref:Uncharacterized protein n=1 Tax=Niallia oryzisoli TaxID=1737571 RepID=A0ABZ2CKW9_9BACI
MTIIRFPNKRNNERKSRLIVDSDQKSFINHDYIQKVLDEKGYKKADDILIKELNHLID